MKKIMIISFYELKEYLLAISNNFKNIYKWDVCNYPLYMNYYDTTTKKSNIIEHFVECINKEQPDIILWWLYDIPNDVILKIKEKFPNIYYIIYEYEKINNLERLTYFNYVIKYEDFIFGYDELLFRKYNTEEIKSIDKKYFSDVSLYYNHNNKNLVLEIEKYCVENDLKFNLYGNNLCSSFVEEINYSKLPHYFNSSYLNIISSNLISSAYMCNNNIMIMDNNIIEKLKNNITDKNDYSQYTWFNFCKLIFVNYNKKYFNYKFYIETYGLELKDEDEIYKYWLDKLEKNIIDIPYDFEIPSNFDLDNYKKLFKLENYTDKYFYIQWFMCGKDKNYLKKNKNFIFDSDKYNISNEKIFDLFYGMNLISTHKNIDEGLNIISKIAKQHPFLQINELIDVYNNMI